MRSDQVITVRMMMYGFGDVVEPRPDTTELMEELVMDYIFTLVRMSGALIMVPSAHTRDTMQCTSAANTARMRNNALNRPAATPAIKMDDFLFSLRKDAKKLKRAEELLFRFDELLRARKAFDTTANPS